MRWLLGFVGFVVLYFVGCMIVGGVAGGLAGSQDPANAARAGELAGAAAVQEFRLLIAGTAGLLSLFWIALPTLRRQEPDQS